MRRYITLSLMLLGIMSAFAQGKFKRPDTYNYNRGVEELQNGNYADALVYLNKEVESDPKNGYAFSWIALIRDLGAEYGKALTAADQSLKYLPKKDGEFVAATYVIRAGVYLALGDTVKALGDYSAAVKANPEDADIYEERAKVYFAQRRFDLSDADYRQMIKLDQGSLAGYMGLGRNLGMQERWDEAIEHFTLVTNMYGDYAPAFAFRAMAYVEKEMWAEATDDYVTALGIDGDDMAFKLMLLLKEPALGMMKAKMKIQAAKNPNDGYWPFCLAALHEQNGEYEKAIAYYEESQRKDADDVNLRRIAECRHELGDHEGALRDINMAIGMDSTKVQYLPFKADMLYELGDVRGAIKEWDRLLELDPEYDFGYYRRGWYKGLAGDDEEAVEDFTLAVTLDPDFSSAYLSRGDIYARTGREDLARADYLKVVEIEDSPEMYSGVFYAYLGLGEKEKAVAALDTVIARSEDRKSDYYDAACLYSRMGEREKALEYLEKCLELGYNSFAHIRRDRDMDLLREMPEFRALMEKYEGALKERFPDAGDARERGKEVTTEVPFTKESGVCNVKCRINDLPLYFIFDTGASTVSLSMVEATFMMKNGYLDRKDVVGSQYFQDANGNVTEGTVVNIREVDFGGLKLENVRASVVRNQKAPLLLGQSVLGRLGRIEIDNANRMLRITHVAE